MLIAFSPAAMLYGVPPTDAMFATLGLGAACLLVGSGLRPWVAGGLALAVASFFSWALLALGAFAAVVRLLRGGLRSAFGMALVAGAVLVGFYPRSTRSPASTRSASVRAAGDAYDLGISNARPYALLAVRLAGRLRRRARAPDGVVRGARARQRASGRGRRSRLSCSSQC